MQPTTQLVVKHQVILGVIRKHGQIIQTVVVPRKRNVPLVKGTVTHIVNATVVLFVRLTAAPNQKGFMNVHLAANSLLLNYCQVLNKTLKWPIKIITLIPLRTILIITAFQVMISKRSITQNALHLGTNQRHGRRLNKRVYLIKNVKVS